MWSLMLSTKKFFFMDRGHNHCLVSTETALFMDRNLKLTIVSTKTAFFMDRSFNHCLVSTETALFMDSTAQSTVVSIKIRFFPGQFAVMMPDAWSAGNATGKYAGQPHKASGASYTQGLAPLLCAPSQISAHYLLYTFPTKPSVATLMRTPGGKTVRRAVKQAIKVDPVVKTSSTSSTCRMSLRKTASKASLTFFSLSSTLSLVCVIVCFFLCNMSVCTGMPSSSAMPLAMISA